MNYKIGDILIWREGIGVFIVYKVIDILKNSLLCEISNCNVKFLIGNTAVIEANKLNSICQKFPEYFN